MENWFCLVLTILRMTDVTCICWNTEDSDHLALLFNISLLYYPLRENLLSEKANYLLLFVTRTLWSGLTASSDSTSLFSRLRVRGPWAREYSSFGLSARAFSLLRFRSLQPCSQREFGLFASQILTVQWKNTKVRFLTYWKASKLKRWDCGLGLGWKSNVLSTLHLWKQHECQKW